MRTEQHTSCRRSSSHIPGCRIPIAAQAARAPDSTSVVSVRRPTRHHVHLLVSVVLAGKCNPLAVRRKLCKEFESWVRR